MTAYYNENDPYAAQWLRNAIEAGHIARGDVDERSIAGAQHLRQRYWFVAHSAHQNDGRTYGEARKRQEPEFRSRVCPSDDGLGQIRVLGRVLPDASVPLLAHAIPDRLAQYRAFGNAVDPWLAAAFVEAATE